MIGDYPMMKYALALYGVLTIEDDTIRYHLDNALRDGWNGDSAQALVDLLNTAYGESTSKKNMFKDKTPEALKSRKDVYDARIEVFGKKAYQSCR